MSLRNGEFHWGGITKGFHWIIVALILVQGGIGLLMGDLPRGPGKVEVYALHKSIGITILALAVLRLLWRLYAGRPKTVPGTPAWQDIVARLVHVALYVLLFALPISGWMLNSAAGLPLQWFGLFNLPALAGESEALRERAGEMHELLFWVLVLFALMHASAALYHHLFMRDATLARMLPRGWLRAPGGDAPEVDSRNA